MALTRKTCGEDWDLSNKLMLFLLRCRISAETSPFVGTVYRSVNIYAVSDGRRMINQTLILCTRTRRQYRVPAVWKQILCSHCLDVKLRKIWAAGDAICINQEAEYVRFHTLICSARWTSHTSRSQRITPAGTASQMYNLRSGTSGCIDRNFAH
jgi:hypothetical protein